MSTHPSIRSALVLVGIWTALFAALVAWDQSSLRNLAAASAASAADVPAHLSREALIEGLLWLLGTAGILASFFRFRRLDRDRTQATAALRESEQLWRCVFENSLDGILLNNADGTYTAANRAACRIFGLTEAEIVARGRQLFESTSATELATLLAQRADAGSVRDRLRFRKNDGTLIEIEGAAAEFRAPLGPPRVVTVFRDITERCRLETESRENALRWQAALEAAGDGLWDWNTQTDAVYFSPGWKQMLGFSSDELTPHVDEWRSRVHPDDLAATLRELESHLDGTTPAYRSEHRVRCKDGAYKWILDSGRVVTRTPDGRPLRMIGTHKDLTGLRLAEQKLGESEERYRLLFDNASDALIAFPIAADGRPGLIAEANEAAARMIGYSSAELRTMAAVDLETEASRAALPARVADLQREGRALFETEVRSKSGRTIPLEVHTQFFRKQHQTWVLSSMRDIAPRRQAAAEIARLARERQAILETLPVGVCLLKDRKIQWSNSAFATLMGYENAALLGADTALFYDAPAEYRRIGLESLAAFSRGETYVADLAFRRRDGTPFFANLIGRSLNAAAPDDGAIWVVSDIDARVTAERALQRSESQLAATLGAINDLIFVLDEADCIVGAHCPPGVPLLAPREEFIGKPYSAILPPPVAAQIAESLRALAITGEVQHFDYELTLAHGPTWWTATLSRRTDHAGHSLGTVVLVRDITARKRIEQALRDSEEKFYQTFHHAPLIMVVTNLDDGRILEANAMAQRVSGLSPAEGLGRTVVELGWFTAEERAHLVTLLQTQGHVTDLEMIGRKPDGQALTYLVNCQLAHIGGGQRVITALQDISARKLAEARLRESEENYLGLFNTVSEAIYVHGVDGVFLDVNVGAMNLYGFTREELIGQTPAFVAAPDRNDLAAVARTSAEVFATGRPAPFEFWGRRKDGEIFPKACVTHRGKYFGRDVLITTARDITGPRRMEEALIAGERRFRTLFQFSPFGALEEDFSAIKARFDELRATGVTDFNAYFAAHPAEVMAMADRLKIIMVNEGAARLFGISGHAPSAYDFRRHLSPESHAVFAGELVALAEGHTTFHAEITGLDAGGAPVHLDLTLAVQPGHEATLDRVIVSFIDITQRKQAEAALRESEERYRTLVELSPEAIFVHARGKFTFANRAAVRLAGAESSAQLIGLNVMDFVHADSRELVARRLGTLTTEGQLNPLIRQKWHRRDGSVIEVAVVATQVTFDGAPAMLAIAMDLTAQLQAETELRKLSRAVEQSPVTVIITNPQGEFEYVNPSFTATSGYSADEVGGRHVRLLESGELPPEHSAAMWDRVHSGHEWRGEFHNRRKNGETYWVSAVVSPIIDESGRTTHYLAVSEDVTERHAAEARIREQAALLDVTQDAILVLTLDRKITYWNRGAEKIYGVTSAEALGRRYETVAYRDVPADYDAEWQRALARGEWSVERRQIGRVRGEITVQKRATLVRDEQQRPKAVLIVVTDITEAKRLESQFLRAQRLESLGSLASGVAHDLNNVLTPILMSSGLLAELAQNDHDRELIDLLSSSARRGADIVQQLLLYGRGSDSPRSPMSVARVIKEMVQLMRETFPRDIDLVSDVPVDLAMIDGDRTQIHQVLMNLCVNARDAMPDGGVLTITAENTHVDAALAAAHAGAKAGAHIAIHVKDSGTGIPREHLDKIFDPFFTTKPLGKGTGLGLATVLGIVRSHGGLVTVESTPGAGAEFVVSIPARAPAVESVAVDPDRANLRGKNELVLVIDDEASIRGALTSTLKLYGYRVLTANDGAAGTNVFSEHAQDVRLVITDIMMPVMDGMQAIRAIRRLNPALPIIAMSGVPTQRVELETTYGPHLRFLPKPFLIEKVLAVTHELLAAAPPPGTFVT